MTKASIELGQELRLDPGYLSRLLRTLQDRGLLGKRTSKLDGRQSLLSLTAAGRRAFARLDAASQADIQALLDRVPPARQQRLVDAMRAIEMLIGAPGEKEAPADYTLRPHRPGDMGWIVHRQAVLYHQEYGWSEAYEALIERITADFGDRTAARAGGDRFARQAGYHTLTLWTNSVLVSARRLYEAEGYRLVEEQPHHSFGQDLVGQTWELTLAGTRPRGTRSNSPR